MIEITMIVGGERVAWAEAEDPEAAMVAGRTLWDDNIDQGWYGSTRRLTFKVDGKIVYMTTVRPNPSDGFPVALDS